MTGRGTQPPQSESSTERFFAPCPRGLEAVLAGELRAIGAQHISQTPGGVGFAGTRQVGWLANLCSRIASRVLLQVAQGRYRDDDDLYRLANRIEWERWFSSDQTVRVDLNAIRSPLRSLNFVTLRIKDGLVDRFRTRTGSRPSVDTEHPDVRVFGFLQERSAVLYLDLSGEPLFKRGWRSALADKGEAPLKENLAAGLLALAGWQPGTPLYDPFCGSGTIVIEAGQQALGIAPGAARSFAFEHLADFDADAWRQLRETTLAVMRGKVAPGTQMPIFATDIDPQAVDQTRRNARRAGISQDLIQISICDASKARPPCDPPGLIVSNPPYGERIALGRGEGANWEQIGQTLREGFGGWQAWLLTSDQQLPRRLGMRERRRAPLFNGPIECRLFGFEVFAPGEIRPRRGARSPD